MLYQVLGLTRTVVVPALGIVVHVAATDVDHTGLVRAQPVTNIGIKPRTVDLVWRRLGYPSSEVWRHIHSATANFGVSAGSPAPTYSSPEERLAVARGRMRAGAFPGNHLDDPPEEPLMKLYMDFAGPTAVASHIHGYRHYCGVTDGFSGLTRVYGCRAPTAAVAVYALQQFLIYARVLLKSAIPVTPIVVRTDQGAAFTSVVFAEYIRSPCLLNCRLRLCTHHSRTLL